jgi:hypothetical protein
MSVCANIFESLVFGAMQIGDFRDIYIVQSVIRRNGGDGAAWIIEKHG